MSTYAECLFGPPKYTACSISCTVSLITNCKKPPHAHPKLVILFTRRAPARLPRKMSRFTSMLCVVCCTRLISCDLFGSGKQHEYSRNILAARVGVFFDASPSNGPTESGQYDPRISRRRAEGQTPVEVVFNLFSFFVEHALSRPRSGDQHCGAPPS